jgi:hypothetical protein
MRHKFHFVLTKDLKNSIREYSIKINKSYSQTVIYIIQIMRPQIKNHYYNDIECQIKNYEKIDANEELFIYLEKKDYRFIRQIKNHMYIFSMAKIIRWILNEYFSKLDKYGSSGWIRRNGRCCRLHLKDILNKGNWKKQIPHMFNHINTTNAFRLTFSEDFTLLGFEFF